MRTSSGPGGQPFPTDRSPPTPPGQTAPDQRDIQAKKFKVLSQDLDDPNRRSVQIEKAWTYLFSLTQDSTFDFLKGRYLFRFPFLVTAINWGVGLGLVLGLHTYFRTRNVGNSVYWFFAGGILTGMPIFGFLMFRYTFYSTSIKRFEKEQNTMVEESNYRREYLMKKLNVKNKEVSDEALLQRLIEEKEQIGQKYSLIATIVPERDF